MNQPSPFQRPPALGGETRPSGLVDAQGIDEGKDSDGEPRYFLMG